MSAASPDLTPASDGPVPADVASAAPDPHRAAGRGAPGWGRGFDPARLATLELRMWKAYYRRQGLRLVALLVEANHEQAGAGWPRALLAALWLAWAAIRFGRSTGDYDRYLPDIERSYRLMGLPDDVDAAEVARRELRWWVVRREIGLSAGDAAGQAIAELYAAIYGLPVESVAEAGRLRGLAAEVRDRGATADPDGPAGEGRAYWPDVARLLQASYRELRSALDSADDSNGAGAAMWGDARAGEPGVRAATNDYHFITRWRIPATADEITAILSDAQALARWWPSVYLDVRVLEPGDERGVGKVVDLWTSGWLPYTLRWRFEVTEVAPDGFTIVATGDFDGRGIWTLRPDPVGGDAGSGEAWTLVEYDWRIRAEKPLLRRLSFLMKPLFSANHRWAMARGEESLRLEVARRHAAGDPALLAAIAAAPPATFGWLLALRRRS
ncbi:MAG TPA: SRPBCC family protein [Candidatus Dormibacteraeota bacterium]|nr:SRPBCC family protein [Candidatus Dormibacteraeota bacterium]